jgi:glucosylceramidase
MVTIHSQTKELTRSGQYWAFAHFSRFVKRGARLVESTGGGDVVHAAFQNPDGTRVLVLANSGAAQAFEVLVGGQATTVQVGRNAVATLVWQ